MKLLKSVILTVALLAGAGVARAALDFPSVPTLSPGKNATLTVGAGTTAGTTALQFTMTLPEGIALANTTVTSLTRTAPPTIRIGSTRCRRAPTSV